MPQKLDVAPELCEFAEMHIALKFAPANPEVRKLVSKEKARLQKAALAAQPRGRLGRHAVIAPDGSLYLVRLTRGKAAKSRKPRITVRAAWTPWDVYTIGWPNCRRCHAEVLAAFRERNAQGRQRIIRNQDGSVYGWKAINAEDRRMLSEAAEREIDGTAYRRTS